MTETGPTRTQGDLAEMLETLLDKGVVVNADIAVSVGDTELLGVRLRAAIASFETAAEYGLEFPGGTDMDRVYDAAGVDPDATGPGRDAVMYPEEAEDDGEAIAVERADADDEDGERADADATGEHDG